MASRKYLNAQWRKKKLEEDAQQFRAKEALRLRIHRARQKERTAALRHAVISSNDVDTWLAKVVDEDDPSLHAPSSFSRTSRATSPISEPTHTGSPGDLHNKEDDNNSCSPSPSLTVEHQDALKLIINAEKTIQEWDTKWGKIARFSFPLGLSNVPVDGTHGELMALVTKGNEMLKELESVSFFELQSIRANVWVEVLRLVGGIQERITHTTEALKSHIDM